MRTTNVSNKALRINREQGGTVRLIWQVATEELSQTYLRINKRKGKYGI